MKILCEQGTHCTAKTGNFEILPKHRILFAQVINSPILKVKDIARENIRSFFRSWICEPSQFCVCNSHKSRRLAQGKICRYTGKNQGI